MEELIYHKLYDKRCMISADRRRVICYSEGKPVFAYALEKEYHWDGDNCTEVVYDV